MSEYSAYTLLSEYYDRFTDDVPYDRWADFFEKIFAQRGQKPEIILDLACGTGKLTCILARRGYDMIGVDQSEDMLMMAQENCGGLTETKPVLLLHQPMQRLELFGGIDACVCCLDSVNYVTDPDVLHEAFRRVYDYLRPGGVFVFDINTRAKLERIDGQSFVREDEDIFCVWQAEIEQNTFCHYAFDFFERGEENAWHRYQEHHMERIYAPEELLAMLKEIGFVGTEQRGELSDNAPSPQEERIFFITSKPLK
ncbi:MAG TPA: class I SAM-dependent methyltransferase [Clostridiales bacterium]|nr:class I SAM-dependent methyltransferase [Clostridiales bacterium]